MLVNLTNLQLHLFFMFFTGSHLFAIDSRLKKEDEHGTKSRLVMSKSANNDTILNIEEFLGKYIVHFCSARKQLITGLDVAPCDSKSLLKLLEQFFSDYTFFESDVHQFTGYSPQALLLGDSAYKSKITYQYILKKDLNVINLSIVNADNYEMVCQTINYTGKLDAEFLHMKDPNSTIVLFKEILLKENNQKFLVLDGKAKNQRKSGWFFCFSSAVVPSSD